MNILRKRVLVLNKDWTAIGTCTVQRAMKLMFNIGEDGTPKAKAVAEDLSECSWEEWLEINPGDNFIRSVNKNIKAPQVIVCRTKVVPRLYANFTRAGVFLRDGSNCQYCNKHISGKNLTIDHVLPRCRGGKHNWYNCVTSCVKCNNYKGDMTPEEAGMKLLKVPGKPPLIMCEGPIPELWKKFI